MYSRHFVKKELAAHPENPVPAPFKAMLATLGWLFLTLRPVPAFLRVF
jgi:hypothetical protein